MFAAQPDDLSDEAPAAHPDNVVEASSIETGGDDDGPGYSLYLAGGERLMPEAVDETVMMRLPRK